MSSDSTDDVFARWRSKQPRKLFRVFYKGNTFDVLAHTEDEVHEQLSEAITAYLPRLSKIKENNV